MRKKHKLTSFDSPNPWLTNHVTESEDKRYRHRRLEENLDARTSAINELQLIVYEAHEDARQRLRQLVGISLDPLDPFAADESDYPVEEYPKFLNIQALKGCFGEIFAGIVAENFPILGENWEVPAYLFRFHLAAFQQLEMLRQTNGRAGQIPGRTGDDCVAFQRNSQGKIMRSLICEAKCTYRHDSTMIAEAHEKASAANLTPIDLTQLIEILSDDDDAEAIGWVKSLRELLFRTNLPENYERCDLVSYICGLPPVRETTELIPRHRPHPKYTANRRLESVEIHLYDVEGLVAEAYKKEDELIQTDDSVLLQWQQVIAKIPKTPEVLIKHCRLLAFDGQTAIVSVDSLAQFREVLRLDSKIKDAFTESGLFELKEEGKKVNVKLKVVA
jgi:hypothetical protein